ncbi:hypothetical protein C4N9_20705 [Pararhodobacter marinus]|uniref:Uncharacterized protein n=1 Tax=Pararhodobacter marinus TaxID=2184063 RepID=A0A2U2C4F1_9RHOB|nr:hypothetical protein [Pararhodobacter marinus]PWE26684.1 hypothetical protein C4N9_20705 [Pararhodobacter marinus]
MTDEHTHYKLLNEAAYMVNNPSAWDSYDEGASEMIRALVEHAGVLGTEKHGDAEAIGSALARATAAEAQLAAAMEGAVRVKPGVAERAVWSAMIWAAENSAGWQDVQEYTDGGNSFAEGEARATVRRIIAALEPNPAAQAERDALIAATLGRADKAVREALEAEEDKGNCCGAAISAAQRAIRALATQPQTGALAARDRVKVVEGMREAAGLFQGSDLWEEAGVRQWILAAADAKEAVKPADERGKG